MLVIEDRAALAHVLSLPIDNRLKALLASRGDRLSPGDAEGQWARFIVAEAGDSADAIEQELGFSPLRNRTDRTCFGEPSFTPECEWLLDHGHCWELIFAFSDSSLGEYLFVPDQPGVNLELKQMCDAFAEMDPD